MKEINACIDEIEEIIEMELQVGDYQAASKRIVLRLRERFAKGSLYIPFDYHARNHEIKRRYNGLNARQLGCEFNLSTRQINNIVNGKN